MGMLFVFIPRVSLRLPWAMCLLGLQPTLPKSETLESNDWFGLKKPTIYSPNYTFLFRDGNHWPKYAILSAFM